MEYISKFFVSVLMIAGLVMSMVFLVYSFNDLQQEISSNAVGANFLNLTYLP